MSTKPTTSSSNASTSWITTPTSKALCPRNTKNGWGWLPPPVCVATTASTTTPFSPIVWAGHAPSRRTHSRKAPRRDPRRLARPRAHHVLAVDGARFGIRRLHVGRRLRLRPVLHQSQPLLCARPYRGDDCRQRQETACARNLSARTYSACSPRRTSPFHTS